MLLILRPEGVLEMEVAPMRRPLSSIVSPLPLSPEDRSPCHLIIEWYDSKYLLHNCFNWIGLPLMN
ncbi:hypothetical protein D9Q81_09465 [Candidatus Korarchaeum cryptofilum]|uniref:Uncharacterized protein n=1 Tax=Candidatus Korarchaeum cryptofilum TaxID=498846 RepID=A0A3R9Q7N2_9CREN|nr:hypothetical protein D9Q81_09465 [Candidatus Korarchaeum cryptofilum]